MIQDSNDKNNFDDYISSKLYENVSVLKNEFSYPANIDFICLDLYLKNSNINASLIFLAGMVDEDEVQEFIIEPLSKISGIDINDKSIFKNIFTSREINKLVTYEEVCDAIVMGYTILLVDGFGKAISLDTESFEHRSIEKPVNENVINGPQEAFVESALSNRSLIRKQLRDKHLITESIVVGKKSKNNVYMAYKKDIVSQLLIDNVKKKINNINSDYVQNISILEQYIEERQYSIIPSVLYTERPDRAASFINQGHIVLLMDSSPSCLIAPVTFWSLFHTSEDTYQRWAYGNFIRLVRLFALFISLLTPALFVAITTYHVETVPTDLLLSITATRERVPFPVIVEVGLMEAAFELLRESGIRIPTPIGPTIGIVGALILGQAAVEANLVSSILVIVVAVTGLASFAIPNNSLNFIVRIAKFGLLILGGTMGIIGVTAGLMILISYIVSIKSFDVPFLSPLAPYYKGSKDTVFRSTIIKQLIKPSYINSKDYTKN